jgi:hypothetical protein
MIVNLDPSYGKACRKMGEKQKMEKKMMKDG